MIDPVHPEPLPPPRPTAGSAQPRPNRSAQGGDEPPAYPCRMSTAPAPGPRDAKQPKPQPKLIFDDPLDQQSADDTDRGWGERPPGGDSAADLARFLDEKPPHHL